MNDSSPARDIHATFLDEDMEWAAKARCALYTSMGGKFLWTSDDRRDQEKAKELCLDCPAFSGCQAFVTRNRVKLCGVYAGIYYPHRNDALGATKVCPWCLEEKPLYEFKKRKETRCRDCRTLRRKESNQRELLTPESSRS